MKKVDKVSKFSNKTNPICKEMLHILKQRTGRNVRRSCYRQN